MLRDSAQPRIVNEKHKAHLDETNQLSIETNRLLFEMQTRKFDNLRTRSTFRHAAQNLYTKQCKAACGDTGVPVDDDVENSNCEVEAQGSCGAKATGEGGVKTPERLQIPTSPMLPVTPPALNIPSMYYFPQPFMMFNFPSHLQFVPNARTWPSDNSNCQFPAFSSPWATMGNGIEMPEPGSLPSTVLSSFSGSEHTMSNPCSPRSVGAKPKPGTPLLKEVNPESCGNIPSTRGRDEKMVPEYCVQNGSVQCPSEAQSHRISIQSAIPEEHSPDGAGFGKTSLHRSGTPSSGRSRRSIISKTTIRKFLPRWRQRSLPQQVCALVRHGERADTVADEYGGSWLGSYDSKLYPNDPPLTENGRHQARSVGKSLCDGSAEYGTVYHIVVTSPYLRCMQTAVEICSTLHLPLLIDYEVGEIYGPATMGAQQPDNNNVTRSWDYLSTYCSDMGVKVRGKPVGVWPTWPESLSTARLRFARRYLTYLHRSLLARRNFILVTHADAVASAMTIMPCEKDQHVVEVNFCGYFLARRQIDATESKVRAAEEDAMVDALTFNCVSPPSSQEPMESPGISKGWTLTKKGIKVKERPGNSKKNQLRLWGSKKSSGYTWGHIEQLLGELPPEVMSELSKDADDGRDKPHLRASVSQTFSQASASTFWFGQSERASSLDFASQRGNSMEGFSSQGTRDLSHQGTRDFLSPRGASES